MSLINDALKRASSTRPERPPEAFTAPPLQPVEEASRKNSPVPLVLFITGIGAMLVSGAFWLKSKGSGPEPLSEQKVASLEEAVPSPKRIEAQPAPSNVAPPAVSSNVAPVASPQVAAVEQPEPLTVPATAPTTQNASQPNETTPEPVKPEVTFTPSPKPAVAHTSSNGNRTTRTSESAAAPKQPTAPRLQAIYYRLKGPTVLINGKTLRTGESVDGIKVIAIERNGVDVDVNGSKQRLTLR